MMLSNLRNYLHSFSTIQTNALGFALLLLVASLDHVTGYEWSFSIFYLVPVVFITWYATALSGYIACVLAAIAWLVVDIYSGHVLSSEIIYVWNCLVRLGFFVVTSRLLSQLKAHLEIEKRLAKTDSLTGLLNLQGLKQESDRLLQLATRYQHPVAVAFINLDDFKRINDTFGHAEGDRVLQAVARTLEAGVRVTDLVARLGGDEFVVFLAETEAEDAQRMFDRIHRALTGVAKAADWPIGFSVGVASYASAPSSVEQALKTADRLMYRVKSSGKNSVASQVQGQTI